MQTKSLPILLTAISLATAQSLADLPSCATNGAIAAIGTTGCITTDTACICASQSFTHSLQSYAKANCSPQDYDTAITVGQTICAAAGVTVSSSAMFSGSMDPSMDPSITMSMSTTMSDAASAMATDPAMSMTNETATVTECGCEEGTLSATKPAVVATFTGAAAVARVVGAKTAVSVVAMGLLAWV